MSRVPGTSGDFDTDLFAATILSIEPDAEGIDRAVRVVVEAFRLGLGECNEQNARQAIAVLIWHAKPHMRALGDTARMSVTEREDFAASVFEVLLRRILDNAAGNGFDLNYPHPASACGWAWCLARSVARYKHRDRRRAQRRNGVPSDPEAMFRTNDPEARNSIAWNFSKPISA